MRSVPAAASASSDRDVTLPWASTANGSAKANTRREPARTSGGAPASDQRSPWPPTSNENSIASPTGGARKTNSSFNRQSDASYRTSTPGAEYLTPTAVGATLHSPFGGEGSVQASRAPSADSSTRPA